MRHLARSLAKPLAKPLAKSLAKSLTRQHTRGNTKRGARRCRARFSSHLGIPLGSRANAWLVPDPPPSRDLGCVGGAPALLRPARAGRHDRRQLARRPRQEPLPPRKPTHQDWLETLGTQDRVERARLRQLCKRAEKCDRHARRSPPRQTATTLTFRPTPASLQPLPRSGARERTARLARPAATRRERNEGRNIRDRFLRTPSANSSPSGASVALEPHQAFGPSRRPLQHLRAPSAAPRSPRPPGRHQRSPTLRQLFAHLL